MIFSTVAGIIHLKPMKQLYPEGELGDVPAQRHNLLTPGPMPVM
jgi:hypothetical protein